MHRSASERSGNVHVVANQLGEKLLGSPTNQLDPRVCVPTIRCMCMCVYIYIYRFRNKD